MPRIHRRPTSRKQDFAAYVKWFLNSTVRDLVVGERPRNLGWFDHKLIMRHGEREVVVLDHANHERYVARLAETPGETLRPGERPYSPDVPPSFPPRDRPVLLLPSEDPGD
jgi:hypothetical protein